MGNRFEAIILSAGYSSRMKAFKPLLPLGGASVLEQAVSPFLDSGLAEPVVVTGYRADDIRPVLHKRGLREAHNPDFDKGMFSSVQTGVQALSRDVEGFFVLPVDLPLVRPHTVKTLVETFNHKSPPLLHPTFKGRPGHPPLIGANLIDHILAWPGSRGLKGALEQFKPEAMYLEVPDRNILFDMDHPDEYQAILERWSTRESPSREEAEIILESADLSDLTRAHCRTAARLAEGLALALNQTGLALDVDLIYTAALVHDVGKGARNHARAGADFLEGLGFSGIAPLVRAHSDSILDLPEEISPLELVYLADKMLVGADVVPPFIRFISAMNKGGADPVRRKGYQERLETSHKITARLEERLGEKIKTIIDAVPGLSPMRGLEEYLKK